MMRGVDRDGACAHRGLLRGGGLLGRGGRQRHSHEVGAGEIGGLSDVGEGHGAAVSGSRRTEVVPRPSRALRFELRVVLVGG